MNKGLLTAMVLLAGSLACHGQQTGSVACDLATWMSVGELYARAVSSPDEFAEWLAASKARYPARGSWERCGKRLAEALIKMALSPSQAGDIDERAASVAGRAGAPELGPQVAASMRETANEPARLGYWLSEVLRSAPGLLGYGTDGREDDLAPFEALADLEGSEVFTTARLIWNSLSAALPPNDVALYRKILMEMNVGMIVQFGQSLR